MGSAVADAAGDRGWTMVGRFDLDAPFTEGAALAAAEAAEVVIDFSVAEAVRPHVEQCCKLGLPLIIGSTGWSDRLDDIRDTVMETNGAVLYAPNFSLGVAILTRAMRAVTPLLDRLEAFDVSIHEVHHTGKRDSPSGTALRLAELLLDGIRRKTAIKTGQVEGAIRPDVLQVTAARTGNEFGHHTVWIDGPSDRLLLTHEARSRRGFAEGALAAAEWIVGRTGFFTLDDMLDEWLSDA